jgi:hypothetical protein
VKFDQLSLSYLLAPAASRAFQQQSHLALAAFQSCEAPTLLGAGQKLLAARIGTSTSQQMENAAAEQSEEEQAMLIAFRKAHAVQVSNIVPYLGSVAAHKADTRLLVLFVFLGALHNCV